MTSGQIAKHIKELAKAAQPEDKSAPLQPVIDLGNFVLAYAPKIIASLERKR